MKRFILPLLLLTGIASAADSALLIQLGLHDKESTVWDGSVTVTPGEVLEVNGYRFEQKDAMTGKNSWKASSRTPVGANAKARGNNPKKIGQMARQLGPIFENGVYVKLRDVTPESSVEVTTAQGKVSFKLADVKPGEALDLMEGRVAVQQTAFNLRVFTKERTDDDFPALAFDAEGHGFLVYQSFTPGIDRDERAKRWDTEPEDLSFLNKPAGGDQLWLHVRPGKQWEEQRMAVTETGRDIYKSAVAADGKGGAWIVWSERVEGNFEILARHFAEGKLGEVENLSKSAGNDLNPVIARSAKGTLVLAWMAAQEGKFEIRTRTHEGGAWAAAQTVSKNSGNCWNPALSADARAEGSGQFALAWDTYEKGDYDIWMCVLDASGRPAGAPMPVANTPQYEARAAVTHDREGRVWVAYEKSGATWGKDWGAYDSGDGIGLYRNREIGVSVWDGKAWAEPQGSIADALPGAITPQARGGKGKGKGKGRGADVSTPAPPASPEVPDGLAFEKPAVRGGAPGAHVAVSGPQTYNNLGRICCDSEGRVWLIARTRLNSFRGPLGSTWGSVAAYLDGGEWVGPISIPHSDNLMYNLPAIATGPKMLFVAHSSDHRMDRMAEFNRSKTPGGKGGNAALDASKDPFDNDVYFSRLIASGPVKPAVLQPRAEPPLDNPAPSKRTEAERAEVAAIRGFRSSIAGTERRILRGEFHRHTEISGDGANDGPLEDMWRYAIDAASMDWIGNGDHDNGNGREYSWWLTQKTTDAFFLPKAFTPMFSYERSVVYPEGHRNVVFAQRGVRTLPRLPLSDVRVHEPAPDTNMLYKYLKLFNGVCASHTSVGSMGTDWRNWGGEYEPMVEIYQGARQNYEYPGCPRCPTENDAIGGWEPGGWVCDAFAKGYKFSFQSSSDHGSTHISYAMIYAEDYSREGIIKAMRQRHTYGATDNIIAESRCKAADGKERMMGDEFGVKGAPTISLKLIGTMPFEKVTLIKDNVEIPMTIAKEKTIDLTWTDPKPEKGKTSYYYFRGEQTNGELVWVSPMWITLE
ncbi:hypothetical protein [Prosthecobacter fluviatilis]|uniref:DUF3604 domain-containing protein n=1 Tax=Prosthecobacter fluviatilis TaxID=445931 RepID=A0ABW0KV63_9BACT